MPPIHPIGEGGIPNFGSWGWMAKHVTPNTGQMRSTVDWLHVLTAQEEKTLHATQGYVEVALRSEQLEAVEGMPCSIKRARYL